MTAHKSDLREPPVHVVLIDSRGVITGIQTHGGQSAAGGQPAHASPSNRDASYVLGSVLGRFSVGDSYFDYCDDDDSRADVQALLRRKRTITSFVISSRAPRGKNVVVVLGVPVSPEAGSGAVLMHVDVSAWARHDTADDAWPMPVTLNPALLQDTISKALVSQFAEPQRAYQAHPDIDSLSPRQREVLLLVAAGKSNLEISEELLCSLNTVKRHVTAVLQKLHLPNRTRAANLANQLNLLPPSGHRR
jgi:DNA-binding CsgD family transcriptional regulator